jgi:hypothetical protein
MKNLWVRQNILAGISGNMVLEEHSPGTALHFQAGKEPNRQPTQSKKPKSTMAFSYLFKKTRNNLAKSVTNTIFVNKDFLKR